MGRPKLSVVLSVYNGEQYIKESVDSLLAQSFKDFELIVIDDGSTDDTDKILKSYQDPRIKIYDQSNKGLVKSLNLGVELSGGEYIARQDADDRSEPERFEKQMAFLEANPKVVLIGSSMSVMGTDSKIKHEHRVLLNDPELKQELLVRSPFAHGSVVFRKAAFDKAGGYKQDDWPAEDYGLWLRMASEGLFANIDEPLYVYRETADSISSKNLELQEQKKHIIQKKAWLMRRSLQSKKIDTSGYANLEMGQLRIERIEQNMQAGSPASPDITIAIPTYRREAVLINTIEALLRQSHQNFELIIVDQSTEHLPETVKALANITDERFRYIKAQPPSLPAARNFCLKNAKAPIVLFLDDDIEPSIDLVKYHLRAFAEHPEVSAVGGRVMQDGFPVKKDVLRFDEYGISHGVFTATQADFTNTFPGGNHSIKIQDALKVGGFDSRYYYNAFREESDMSLKMVRNGMRIYFEPRAEILHLAANEGGTRAKSYSHIYDSARFYRNELFFTLRVVKRSNRIEALRRKYREYCLVVRHGRAYRRRILFFLGLIAAVWRLMFGRQIITREVAS